MMKLKIFNKIKVIGLSSIILISASCSDFLDVNETPNNPTSVPPSALLPTALSGSAFANSNELNRFASTIMSVTYGAANDPAAWDIYNTDGADFGNQWRYEIYNGALINYERLLETSETLNANSYKGIAKIMKAYTFALTTDSWGDIPYSEALKGDENPQPRIDSQKDIYLGNATSNIQSLFDLVKEGLSDLDKESSVDPGVDDIAYGFPQYSDKIASWKRAGNSLLLKLAIQISRVEPEKARQIITEVIQGNNYIVDNSQDLTIKFGGQVGSQAPIHTYTNVSSFRNDLMISTRFVNLLKGLNDPRLPKFVTKPGADYVTVDNGARGLTLPATATWSRFSSYVTGVNGEGPVRLLTNFQRAFILAEAAIRLGTPGNPQALYVEGIRASMLSAGLTGVEIDAYFAANPQVVTLSGTNEDRIRQIITQKYIAQYGNGLEQWNDWRRTGYPVLAQHQNAVGVDGTRPVRTPYINEEISRNPNFPSDVYSNVKVWWDID